MDPKQEPTTLREQVDACRPGSADLHEPEMAELSAALQLDSALRSHFAAVQSLDTAVRRRMREVPVPEGLLERLQQQLAAEQLAAEQLAAEQLAAEQLAAAEVSSVESSRAESPIEKSAPAGLAGCAMGAGVQEAGVQGAGVQHSEMVDPNPRGAVPRGRSKWGAGALLAAALAMAAAVAGIGIWFGQQVPATVTVDTLVASAEQEWTIADDAWQVDLSTAPESHPVGRGLAVSPRGWQPFATRWDRRAVAYDLQLSPAHPSATLYVLQTQLATQPVSAHPPASPQFQTGGLCVGVWQQPTGAVCVLVVKGDVRSYQKLLRRIELG